VKATVTGAFSNSGAAIAGELLRRGWEVATLTNRAPGPAGPRLEAHALRFDEDHLVRALAGTDVLVSTYWVRFPYGDVSFDTAVADIGVLLKAAHRARVSRVVQITVSKPSLDSPLGYYRGKAQVEDLVRGCGLPYGIVRPTIIVGPRDVLTGNMCWFLRRFPLTAVPTGGEYLLQPITLADAARIVADVTESSEDVTVDAAGPDTLPFRDYLHLLARSLGRPFHPVPVPPRALIAMLATLKPLLRDTVLTWEELEALRTNLLTSDESPLGTESALAWLRDHARELGTHYVNDTIPRFRTPARV
jgi:NADH dehydrogenase